MNDQVSKKRPLLFLVNGKHDEVIQGRLQIDCRTVALDVDRILELLAAIRHYESGLCGHFPGAPNGENEREFGRLV